MSSLQIPAVKVLPESIEQRWPREVLEALPRIDAERVREITWTFRKRTSSADDHAAIETPRELEVQLGAVFPAQIVESLDRRCG